MHLSFAAFQSSRYFKSNLRAKLKAIGHSSEKQCGSLPVGSVCWTRLGVAGKKKKKKWRKKSKKEGRESRRFTADRRYFHERKNSRSVSELRTRVSDAQSSAAQLFSHSRSGRGKTCSPINRFKMPFPAQMGYLGAKMYRDRVEKGFRHSRRYICLVPLLFFVSCFFSIFFFFYFWPRLLRDRWYRFKGKRIFDLKDYTLFQRDPSDRILQLVRLRLLLLSK